jgi:hypothetical protein
MFCDVDASEFASSGEIVGLIAFVIEKHSEIFFEGIGWCVGMNLHNYNKY